LDLTKKQEEKEKGLVQCASWLVWATAPAVYCEVKKSSLCCLCFPLCFARVCLYPWEYRKDCHFVKCPPFCFYLTNAESAMLLTASVSESFLYEMIFTLVNVHALVLSLSSLCRQGKASQRSILSSSLKIDLSAWPVLQFKT
jgi:hypothetical protein